MVLNAFKFAQLACGILIHNEAQHQEDKAQGRKKNDAKIQELEIALTTPVKRCKRRESSVDEDSSTRVERLKAKKNLDGPGTSKAQSFLSFPNARIRSTITSLGIDLGSDVENGIDNVKELEYNKLLEASNLETKDKEHGTLGEENESDLDSDLGFDYNAIQHLVGYIVEEVLGNDGSLLIDFKPTPRNKKEGF
jgi:hypothetical protein